MDAKIIGKINVPKKKKKHYQRPLKVSLGDAMRKAWALRGSQKAGKAN